MTDEQLEAMLTRFQPAAPDAAVRARVLAAAADRRVPLTSWDWTLAAAAAVLLVAALATDAHRPPAAETALDAAWRAEVAQVAESIGGDDRARQLAATLVPRPEPLVMLEPQQEELW